MRRRWWVAALVPVAVLTACTTGGGPPTPSPSGAASGSQTPGANPQKISPANLPQPPKMQKTKGAVKDATFGACATTAGTQQVSGTIKNTTDDERDFVITMNWTNDTYDVLGRGIAVVKDLDGGKTAEWALKAKVPEGATTCTPNVVGGELS